MSPVLQSSLGNLCPLYILAGNGECLRDEIIYLAHKAAHPDKYPVRKGVLRDGRRQKENAEKFRTPTKVSTPMSRMSMQVVMIPPRFICRSMMVCTPLSLLLKCVDHRCSDMCHVLTVFTFTEPVSVLWES